ncbi:hypothetical protein CDD80_1040 [Ophiocordyceps camponoti-rufipedis]|uniref:Large ribosomal subunit protein mL67 n=1 Tax=Ophiocordyceps camponoti-rufipedis TaxID=2004952 RepID=A0A2C5YCB1_9HYPO|nr:hypothetical protein CDD80_1040 [Ophiocordyceps camponoti-rufipedis]
MKQLPFLGKKTKPAKIRKDLWAPLACIKFPEGRGEIGTGVFRLLRELKHLSEVSWDKDLIYKMPSEYTDHEKERLKKNPDAPRPQRTLEQRARAICHQKAQIIANMAAILAGEGAGNRMWTTQLGVSMNQHIKAQTLAELKVKQLRKKIFRKLRGKANILAHEEDQVSMMNIFNDKKHDASKHWAKEMVEARMGLVQNPVMQLCPVTISWADEQDKQYAVKWSPNVKHDVLSDLDRSEVQGRSPDQGEDANSEVQPEEQPKVEMRAESA